MSEYVVDLPRSAERLSVKEKIDRAKAKINQSQAKRRARRTEAMAQKNQAQAKAEPLIEHFIETLSYRASKGGEDNLSHKAAKRGQVPEIITFAPTKTGRKELGPVADWWALSINRPDGTHQTYKMMIHPKFTRFKPNVLVVDKKGKDRRLYNFDTAEENRIYNEIAGSLGVLAKQESDKLNGRTPTYSAEKVLAKPGDEEGLDLIREEAFIPERDEKAKISTEYPYGFGDPESRIVRAQIDRGDFRTTAYGDIVDFKKTKSGRVLSRSVRNPDLVKSVNNRAAEDVELARAA